MLLLMLGSIYSQGITLLYKGGAGWNDPTSWIQLNAPMGQIPVQRVPTELDDVIFNQALSGIATVTLDAELGTKVFTVGGSGTIGYRCRSLHISNTEIYFDQTLEPEVAATILVNTNSGGYVLIDSGSNVVHGIFNLQGGNPSITDLTILNSKYGKLFSRARWSAIEAGSTAQAKFINSALEGWVIGGHGNGGKFYADNCSFMTPTFRMAENSTDTLLDCNIIIGANFVEINFAIELNAHVFSSNVNITSFSALYFTTSGTQLNGNVTIENGGGFVLTQEDPAHPLPSIINGNLMLAEGIGVNIQGGLKISGNFISSGIPASIGDTSHVYVNGQRIFRAGGIGSICGQIYCPANIEFFGNTNSNIKWPVGFPVDTLVINKSGCAKVTVTNSLYVSGAAKILKGQLVLKPNDTVPYKFVCAGDLEIMEGGGIFLSQNEYGVANIAVDGNLTDHNSIADSSCTGLTNPYNGNITLYHTNENAGNHSISLANTSSIGNLQLIGKPGSGFILGSNLTVNHFNFTGGSNLLLGDHNLIVTGNIEMTPY